MKLPKTLYVRIEDTGKDAWFSAEDTLDEAASDEGPADVGVYQLVEVKRVQKVLQVMTASKVKH